MLDVETVFPKIEGVRKAHTRVNVGNNVFEDLLD